MNRMQIGRHGAGRVFTRRKLLLATPGFSLLALGALFGVNEVRSQNRRQRSASGPGPESELERKFAFLSTHGNSNCSLAFMNSILSMTDDQRLQGSCCSPMVLERYKEQTEGLQKYSGVALIPPDPYDISASLAKKLLESNTPITPTFDEQSVLDQAVADSDEKGYCCCQCWRWYVYEGLSKYLVRNERFTAQQIADVLNNSDGCGGDS